jgi:hypothetical protein
MLKANINGTRYPLPESLGDLSLSQFIEFYNLLEADLSTNEFEKRVIYLLTGIPYNLQNSLSLKDYKTLSYNISLIAEDKFENYLPKYRFTHRGETYHLIDLENMSFGTYLDLNNELQNGFDNLPQIIAILFKRKKWTLKGRKFDDTDYLTVASNFHDLSMNNVLGALGFFLFSLNLYSETSHTSSTGQEAVMN